MRWPNPKTPASPANFWASNTSPAIGRHSSTRSTANTFNPYINYHRPYLFPIPRIDSKGKVKKHYPYGKLKSLHNAQAFLKPGITFKQLDAIALTISDNEAAKQMNEAKRQLLNTIFEQARKAV